MNMARLRSAIRAIRTYVDVAGEFATASAVVELHDKSKVLPAQNAHYLVETNCRAGTNKQTNE